MKIAALIARILLGLIFLVFGLNGFFHFLHMPQPAGDQGVFAGILFKSGYWIPIFTVQVLGGILLLLGRFVPLGLTLLAPVIVNILTFHAALAPEGLPMAAVVAILWLVAFVAYRKYFASLFISNAKPS